MTSAKQNGWLENTIVLYTSDHGDMSMEHSQFLKNSFYEPSSRVPLSIVPFNVPGMNPMGAKEIMNLTSHLDIVPTLIELAGGQPLPSSRGHSLVPFLLQQTPLQSHPDYVAMEYHSNFASTGSFALRQGEYKLITFGHTFPWFNATAYPPLLFNTELDPFELRNLAAIDTARVVNTLSDLFLRLLYYYYFFIALTLLFYYYY